MILSSVEWRSGGEGPGLETVSVASRWYAVRTRSNFEKREMCIRDRTSPPPKPLSPRFQRPGRQPPRSRHRREIRIHPALRRCAPQRAPKPFAPNSMSCLRTIRRNGPTSSASGRNWMSKPSAKRGSRPVSYTHLDVYKRQSQGRALPGITSVAPPALETPGRRRLPRWVLRCV